MILIFHIFCIERSKKERLQRRSGVNFDMLSFSFDEIVDEDETVLFGREKISKNKYRASRLFIVISGCHLFSFLSYCVPYAIVMTSSRCEHIFHFFSRTYTGVMQRRSTISVDALYTLEGNNKDYGAAQ